MNSQKWTPLLVIAGPTGSGKSALAIELAKSLNGEILSVDSVQFYRGMDIASAKVLPPDWQGIPHHGIDICDITQSFNVQSFINYSACVLDDLKGRGKLPIITGGSGFYLQSFYRAVTDNISISTPTRERLAALADAGEGALLDAFLKINPDGGGIDLNNPRRLLSHLARCLETGLPVMKLRQNMESQCSPLQHHRKFTILLEWNREALAKRLRQRLQKMIDAGLIREVKSLRERGIELNRSAANAIGYRQVLDFLDGKLTREALEQEILNKTSALVRKQYNWFRNKIPIDMRFNPEIEDSNKIVSEFETFAR